MFYYTYITNNFTFMNKTISIGVLLAAFIASWFASYTKLCESELGTRAFLTGEPAIVHSICSKYDYGQYFSGAVKDKINTF